MSESEQESKQVIICKDCNEQLEYKENWGKEHRQKYPTHKEYRLVDVI
jgi:hypothetical protein